MRIHLTIALLSAVAIAPGCTAIRTGAEIMGAGASIASALGDRAERARMGLGLQPEAFAQLRLGMSEANMRAALGNPVSSTITPEGWVCHTYSPVLRQGGDRDDEADYTDQWKVLTVDRGEGHVVSGWADPRASGDNPKCEGI